MGGQLTSSSVQSTATSFAFEMLSLLMGYKNLEIVEIAFTFDTLAWTTANKGSGKPTVIAPGTSQEFLDIWVIALLLSDHFDDTR
jgi:hypothetical protein